LAITVVWDSSDELAEWTLDGLEVVDGYWQVASGHSEGTATLPTTRFAGLTAPTLIRLDQIERPAGCAVMVRWRSGATAQECEAAAWSPWTDVVYDEGYLVADLATYYANNPTAPVGEYWQIQVKLRSD
jgi:hypothetical protein